MLLGYRCLTWRVNGDSFLLTQLRDEFDMVGVPARLLLRGNTDNPFEKRKKFQRRTSSVLYGKQRASSPASPPSPPASSPKSKNTGGGKTKKQQTGHFKPRRFK